MRIGGIIHVSIRFTSLFQLFKFVFLFLNKTNQSPWTAHQMCLILHEFEENDDPFLIGVCAIPLLIQNGKNIFAIFCLLFQVVNSSMDGLSQGPQTWLFASKSFGVVFREKFVPNSQYDCKDICLRRINVNLCLIETFQFKIWNACFMCF